RLNSHNHAVHDTRPDREPDEASVCHRITRGDNQKHAERCIDTEDHFEIFRATCCVPSPARRPEDGERPYTEDKDKPYDHQDDAQIVDAISLSHVFSSFTLHSVAPGTSSRVHWKMRGACGITLRLTRMSSQACY